MRLDDELLDGPPAPGARVMALARAAEVEAAAARLLVPGQGEALHDLRVALRRLRATLDALEPLLGGAATEKQRRRLRRAAGRTGQARDAEVLGAWLAGARERLQAPYRGALDWVADRVERARQRGAAAVAARALPKLSKALPRLSRRLARAAPQAAAPPPGAPATLAAALAPPLRARVAALREALRGVAGADDEAALHRARLEAKRLRYLLEPLRGATGADATSAVEALRGLQEVLGEWHDGLVAHRALEAALVEAAAERTRWRGRGAGDADLRPGLVALGRLAARRVEDAWALLEAHHLGPQATPLLDLAYVVVGALEARRGWQDQPVVERRLLLTGLPAEAAGAAVEELEQGWVPEGGGRGRVVVVRDAGGERAYRAGGGGLAPLSRGDLEALWPLTEGRRVVKRCHRPIALPGWRLDEYLDRRLVLAVAEAPGGQAPAVGVPVAGDEAGEAGGAGGPFLPAWLEPLVVRDVTDERGYADEVLARRAPRGGRQGA
ncbi:MAG: CHAD domain-containing protein [Anaeromyxobacter sp.]|nr:CHAD domain-containing protein [Anaeromyxobacter sp.]